jgi:hypothetical protein
LIDVGVARSLPARSRASSSTAALAMGDALQLLDHRRNFQEKDFSNFIPAEASAPDPPVRDVMIGNGSPRRYRFD